MAVLSSLLIKLGFDVEDPEAPAGKIANAAGKFAIAGGVVGAAVGVGLAGAMNVEAANDKLAAQLGATPKMAEKLGQVAGNLYANAYGDSIESVNTAVAAVQSSIGGMADASAAKLEKVTAKALDYATAFEVDVNRAVQVAGQAVSTGLAKDATQAFDLITAASQRVPANLREDVIDAADEYGQFFSTLGYDGEQAFAMLVDGAEKGMYGIDKIGDAVKEFTIRSTDMSTSSKDAYKAIGLDARDMANKVLAGGKSAQSATQQVVDGLLKIKDPAKQANTAIALFGTPLEDLNASEIPAFLKSLQGGSDAMEGFGGASRKMGKTLNDNAATNLESFKRQVTQTFVNVVGGQVLPFVNDFASTLATQFGPTLSTVTGFLREHEGAMKTVGVVLGTAVGLIGTVIAITKVWTAVQTALNIVMAMNPIGLVVIAIAALAAGLVYAYKHSETFRNIVNGAFGAVKDFVVAALDWIIAKAKAWGPYLLGALGGPVGVLVVVIVKHWDTIKAKTSAVWNAIVGFVKAIPGKLLGFFLNWTLPGLMIKHWDAAKDGTIRVATSIVNWVKGLPGKIIGSLSSLAGGLRSTASDAFGRMKDAAEDKGKALLTFVRGIPGKITGALGDLKSLLVDAGRNLIGGLISGITDKVGDLKGMLQGVTKMIPDWKGPADKDRKLLTPAGQMIMEGLIDGIEAKLPWLESSLSKITTKFPEALGKVRSILESERDKVSGVIDSLRQGFDSLSSSVSSAFAPDLFQASSVDAFVRDAMSAVGDLRGLRQAWRKLSGWGIGSGFLSNLFASGNGGLILDMAAGTKGDAKQAAWLSNQVGSMSKSLGNKVAANEYGDDIREGNKLLRDIKKLLGDLPKDFGDEVNGAVRSGQSRRRAGG